MYEHIPSELKRLNQWVCWNAVPEINRPDKIKKVPINAKTGEPAQSNNPDTWCDFDTAYKNSGKYSGIGFMFANGYFGVDIDEIEDAIEAYKTNRTEENIVSEFIYTLQTYAEYSVSGKGLHLICKGELPPAGRRSGNVEMYQNGRYFIMTGNIASEFTKINHCTESIKALHEKYISGGSEPTTGIVEMKSLFLNETEVIELINKSKQKNMFNELYHGNWEQYYTSQSEADLALCNILAYWSRRDKQIMDNLFRSSGLMRDKWDKRHGKDTYGNITLDKAIDGCNRVYEPKPEYQITIGQQKADVPKKLYTFDDTGNAERLFDTFGDKIRYSYVNKSWMYYDGRKWHDDFKGVIKKLADEIVENMKHDLDYYIQNMPEDDEIEKQFLKHLKLSRSSKGKTAMVKETEHRVPILPDEIDKHINLLNTPNGIINLKNGEITPHDTTKYITKITYAEITETASCDLWNKFLYEIFNGDMELINYLQKAVGYSLTGSTQEQCIFFCYGQGRNGKSTFLDIISDLMGDYAMNIQPETIMVKNNMSGANSDVARLKGARFVTSVEPNEGVRLNEGLIKQLTGGDKVTARRQYGNEFEFMPEFKIWMATNHKPVIRGTDMGIWRRVHLIPFTVQIPDDKIDKQLKYKLKQELPAIFKWAVDGCLMWQKEGLRQPNAVYEATKEYRSEMDVIGSFIDECCLPSTGQIKASDLYHAYSKWADDNNEFKMSNTKFGKEISKRYEKIKSNAIYYSGISLRNDYVPYQVYFSNAK